MGEGHIRILRCPLLGACHLTMHVTKELHSWKLILEARIERKLP